MVTKWFTVWHCGRATRRRFKKKMSRKKLRISMPLNFNWEPTSHFTRFFFGMHEVSFTSTTLKSMKWSPANNHCYWTSSILIWKATFGKTSADSSGHSTGASRSPIKHILQIKLSGTISYFQIWINGWWWNEEVITEVNA